MEKNEQLTPYNEAINYLKTSPMFNLSLSSKELFHSNFLYWIWKLDPNAFKSLMATLLEDDIKNLDWGDKWEVVREYNSFDLCVKHCDTSKKVYGETKIVSGNVLLVIENKVKSIPYKEQLDRYVNKVKELYGLTKVDNNEFTYHNTTYDLNKAESNNGPETVKNMRKRYCDYNKVRYMLLTLADKLPNKKDVEKDEIWKIIQYGNYIEKLKRETVENRAFSKTISKFLKNNQIISKTYIKENIKDYIVFAEHLVNLYEIWNKEDAYGDSIKLLCTEDPLLTYSSDCKKLRIHDLFYKQRYARLCVDLLEKLKDSECSNVQFLRPQDDKILYLDNKPKGFQGKYNTRNEYFPNGSNCLIGVGYGYFHGEPFLEIKIVHKDKKDYFYIIQVQGISYCHGIIGKDKLWDKKDDFAENWMRTTDVKEPQESENNSSDGVLDGEIFDEEKILYPKYPSSKTNKSAEQSESKDKLPYKKYGDNMIYQSRKLRLDVEIAELLNYMIDDVKKLLKQLNKQQ